MLVYDSHLTKDAGNVLLDRRHRWTQPRACRSSKREIGPKRCPSRNNTEDSARCDKHAARIAMYRSRGRFTSVYVLLPFPANSLLAWGPLPPPWRALSVRVARLSALVLSL